jgi:D-amino-acid dehydrogenase
MAERRDVVVVGGGAVGVWCAYALARAGRDVLLLERSRLAAGSSWGNSGLVTVSACAPIPAPGVISQGLRWSLQRDGAFRLKPRVSPEFLRWVWRFRAHCTPEAARRGTVLLRDLVRASRPLIEEAVQVAPRDFRYRQNGLLVLFRTEQGLQSGLAAAEALRGLEIESRHLGSAEAREAEPTAGPDVVGALHYPEDAHLDPGEFVRAVAELAEAHGARIATGTEVIRLERTPGGSARVVTAAAELDAELVVLANGAWSARTARSLGMPLLVEPAMGYSLTLANAAERRERPLRLSEARTIVTPVGRSLRVTAKLDLVGLDGAMRERRARGIVRAARRYVELPVGLDDAKPWCGFRPLTPDGLPLIGRHPTAGNVVLATGHGHLGVCLAPITASLVAQLAAGGETELDIAPFRPDRFFGRRPAGGASAAVAGSAR